MKIHFIYDKLIIDSSYIKRLCFRRSDWTRFPLEISYQTTKTHALTHAPVLRNVGVLTRSLRSILNRSGVQFNEVINAIDRERTDRVRSF